MGAETRRCRTLTWAVAVLIGANGWSVDASAQSIEIAVTDARERFQRGVAFYLEGCYDAALAELTKAYEISPNYRVLYNLAQVQQQRHDYVAALGLLQDYMRLGGSDIPEDRRSHVESTLARLKARIATISIAGPPGAELSIDDQPAGLLPLAAPVLLNPGKHRVQLRKPAYESLTHQLTIASAETVHIELPLRPVRYASEPRSDAPASGSAGERLTVPVRSHAERSSNAPMWVSLIASVALAGGAATFGLLAERKDAELRSELARAPADRSKVMDLRGSVELNAALCDGLAAGAILGASLFLYFAFSGSEAETNRPQLGGISAGPTGITVIERF